MKVDYRIGNSKKLHTITLNVENRLEAGLILQRALKKPIHIVVKDKKDEIDKERAGNL